MSIDYLPDEMNYERSNLCWNEPATADAFNAGWRAACEAMHAKCGVWIKAIEARADAPQPAPDWRAACAVEKCEDGRWDVADPSGQRWLDLIGWHLYGGRVQRRAFGSFESEASARAALAACTTPPPDSEVKP
jgi:hypothetical protein